MSADRVEFGLIEPLWQLRAGVHTRAPELGVSPVLFIDTATTVFQ